MWITPTTVIKIGGSLLDWPGLSRCLDDAIEAHHSAHLAFVVGGGGAADWIRLLHRTHGITDRSAHTLALQAMDLNAALLHALRPQLPLVADTHTIHKLWAMRPTPIIIQAQAWLRQDEFAFLSDPLPHTWDTTSDAIAARIASRIGADTLVLWKSREIAHAMPLSQAARSGLVDPVFPRTARHIDRVLYLAVRAGVTTPCELTPDDLPP